MYATWRKEHHGIRSKGCNYCVQCVKANSLMFLIHVYKTTSCGQSNWLGPEQKFGKAKTVMWTLATYLNASLHMNTIL